MDCVSSLNFGMCSSCSSIQSDSSEDAACPYSSSTCIFCSRNHHCPGPARKNHLDSSWRFSSSLNFNWSKNDSKPNLTEEEAQLIGSEPALEVEVQSLQEDGVDLEMVTRAECEVTIDEEAQPIVSGPTLESEYSFMRTESEGEVAQPVTSEPAQKCEVLPFQEVSPDLDMLMGTECEVEENLKSLFNIVEIEPTEEDLQELDNMDVDVEDFIGVPAIHPVQERNKPPLQDSAAPVLAAIKNIFLDALKEKNASTQFCFEILGGKYSLKLELNKLDESPSEIDNLEVNQLDESPSSEVNNLPSIHREAEPSICQSIFQTPQKDLCEEDIIQETPLKVTSPCLNLSSMSLSEVPKHRGVIASSGITSVEKIFVKKFCDEFNFVYTDSQTKAYSIMVFKNISDFEGGYTFKFYLALASKAQIVSFDWVRESTKKNAVLPTRNFLWNKNSNLSPQAKGFSPGPLLSGVTLVIELLLESSYPSAEAIQHLLKLTGAKLVKKISDIGNSPFPRFIIFQDDQQLTSQLLNKCSRHSTLAVNFRWICDCLQNNLQLPITDYVSYTFSLSPEIGRMYNIPAALLPQEN